MKLYAQLLQIGRRNRKVEWILPYVKGRSVLDLGCAGEGKGAHFQENWLHAHLDATAAYCLGLDHNESAIKEIVSKGYQAIYGDAQDFTAGQPFDVVVAADIIEHLHDLKGFFLSIRRSLKENGLLIITTPNPWFFLRFVRCVLKGDAGVNPDHVSWFCTGTIGELLNRYRFEIEELKFGSSEPIFYKLSYAFPVPILFHTSIFVAARKKI